MDAKAGNSGGTVDGDAEESEDPSSSSSITAKLLAAQEALEELVIKDDSNNKDNEDADPLSAFRQQWQRELESKESNQSPQRQVTAQEPLKKETEPEDDDEKAKQLFLSGCELERRGLLYEAVQHYKRAVALRPDIERRLYDAGDAYTPEAEPASEPSSPPPPAAGDDEPDDDGDLYARFQRLLERKGGWCEPNVPVKGGHISWLPPELVGQLLRWVVSRELDAAALERVAQTCRGLYLAARQPDLWRALCVRTWGLECGTPKSQGFLSWRDMFSRRPRLRLDGCYISKSSYLRAGENSFQDQFYRPWYLIDYYRYFRFFAEGQALMWTSAEPPAQCLPQLRSRTPRSNHQGIMSGHYRLVGDKVVVVLKKLTNEKAVVNTRFRAKRKDAEQQQDHVFHAELQLKPLKGRRNWQLVWRRYAVKNRFEQWSGFELTPSRYPPLAFSAVRSYTAEADAPLT